MQATKQVVQRALEDGKACHGICVQTIQYAVQQGDPHVAPEHLRLFEDCAQLCQTSEEFMLRGSPSPQPSARFAPRCASSAPFPVIR